MDVFEQIAVKIIKSQENIVGPVAIEQAQRVPQLKLDWAKQEVAINGNESQAIDELVGVYKELFGQISVEVSKDAAAPLLTQVPAGGVPAILK